MTDPAALSPAQSTAGSYSHLDNEQLVPENNEHPPPENPAGTYAHLDNERLLASGLAAEFIGISEIYLRKMRLREDVDGPPFIRIGRRILYRPSDLQRWLDSKLVVPSRDFPAKRPRKKKAEATT